MKGKPHYYYLVGKNIEKFSETESYSRQLIIFGRKTEATLLDL